MAKYDVIRKFYKSDKWKIARAIKIASANGICQDCNKNPGTEVHHIIHLTPDNICDPTITVNQDNLKLLCNECHNKVHGRFQGKAKYYFDEEGNIFPKDKKM